MAKKTAMSRKILVMTVISAVIVTASIVLLVAFLYSAPADQQRIWSNVGQAIGGAASLFSGLALVGLVATLWLQNKQIALQNDQVQVALADQKRGNEVALRQMHMQIIEMAINDPELGRVWPDISPGDPESRIDHYCNLVLYLQKVAFDVGTIDLAELRGALTYLMQSDSIYSFWTRSRIARLDIVVGDEEEEFFHKEVERAYEASRVERETSNPKRHTPPSGTLSQVLFRLIDPRSR